MPKLTTRMKRWYGGLMVASLFTLLVLRYATVKNPIGESYPTSPFPRIQTNDSDPLKWLKAFSPPSAKSPQVAAAAKVIPTELIVAGLFAQRNISVEEKRSLLTWDHLKSLIDHAQALPNGVEAINEAVGVWNNLMTSVISSGEGSLTGKPKEKQCPYFLRKTNGAELESDGYKLQIPCGLTQGSSVTIIGTPNGILGEFRIDLRGEPLPGEPDPPIILHYNVRLHGDKLTEDPVIVQNTWTIARDWGGEERCPSSDSEKDEQVDELDKCNKIVGADVQLLPSNSSRRHGSKPRPYFPFKQGYPFVATLRVGSDGIQMTVDGKHITSFSYREALEPWLVSEVKVSGDLNLISVLASGLPTSEDSEHISDLEALKSPALALRRPLDLVIGVFSTANNFKQRMAVRRTWMQYPVVRSGKVAVRFFVGLHKNKIVNEELWNEAKTYGDVQLMPFVDYYNLITWKTLAICIFGTEVVSAKFVMKTDDDAFVRVDEVLDSLKRINANNGLLYGLINSESQPHRDPNSKWFISLEEWREDKYPPWAHGPGYVISRDIAKSVVKMYKEGNLKMFKLEDVAMGIWIAEMKKNGLHVRYENEARINNEGCKDGYVIAHYQGPREMLCLWQRLRVGSAGARCCG